MPQQAGAVWPFDRQRPTPLTGKIKSRAWRVFWSYLPDWVLTIFLWGVFYLVDKIDGYRRLFDVTDTSLAHPYAEHERVPVWLLAVICGVVPAVLMIIIGAMHRSFWDVHNAILGLILGLGLTVTFTDVVKITVGRPRPDLFDRCQLPAALTANPAHGLTAWQACTQTEHLQEGFRSFPSGHSSFAWCGMIYLMLYLAAKMRTYNQRGYAIKSWILLVPLCCSTLVSVSRTMDYRHHATDVIAGAIVGAVAAWWSYRQYYPPLASPKSWRPYSPRIPRDDDELPRHADHRVGGSSSSEAYSESVPLSSRPGGVSQLAGRSGPVHPSHAQEPSYDDPYASTSPTSQQKFGGGNGVPYDRYDPTVPAPVHEAQGRQSAEVRL